MRKLSLKLGIIFFITLFCIETFMMFFLHVSLTNSRVEEELASLQARGNSHRTVLEQNFNEETLAHVVLMESNESTDVVVTDYEGTILVSSQPDLEISDMIHKIEEKYRMREGSYKMIGKRFKRLPLLVLFKISKERLAMSLCFKIQTPFMR